MAKNYKLGRNNVAKHFARDTEKDIVKNFKSSLAHDGIEIECTNCGKTFKARIGVNMCPYCNETISLEDHM